MDIAYAWTNVSLHQPLASVISLYEKYRKHGDVPICLSWIDSRPLALKFIGVTLKERKLLREWSHCNSMQEFPIGQLPSLGVWMHFWKRDWVLPLHTHTHTAHRLAPTSTSGIDKLQLSHGSLSLYEPIIQVLSLICGKTPRTFACLKR